MRKWLAALMLGVSIFAFGVSVSVAAAGGNGGAPGIFRPEER